MLRVWVIGVLAVLLASCAQQVPPEEAKVFGRVDCRRAEGNPDVVQEFEQAKAICVNRGQAAAIAGTASMPTGRGMSGAIVAGIEQGMAAGQISTATTLSCMAEQGYLIRTKAEHESACAAIEAQRAAEAAKAKPPPPVRRR